MGKELDVEVKWFNTVFFPHHRTARAVWYEEKVLPRLRRRFVILFTPWGPRYSYKERGVVIKSGDKEVAVLEYLAYLYRELREGMPSKAFFWKFLGADSYGTRINGLPEEVVKEYFQSFNEWRKKILPSSIFIPWSRMDCPENTKEKVEVKAKLGEILKATTIERAQRTANIMNGGSFEDYLAERVVEASLIEMEWRPIKISCVGRYKDDDVDGPLPRLYLLPEELHAPWL